MTDTETIDRLFLELSQFTKAKTGRELELERDAARYRWLRSKRWSDGAWCVTRAEYVVIGADCPTFQRLDDAIDNEMK